MMSRKAELRDIPVLTILMDQLGYPTTDEKNLFNPFEEVLFDMPVSSL